MPSPIRIDTIGKILHIQGTIFAQTMAGAEGAHRQAILENKVSPYGLDFHDDILGQSVRPVPAVDAHLGNLQYHQGYGPGKGGCINRRAMSNTSTYMPYYH